MKRRELGVQCDGRELLARHGVEKGTQLGPMSQRTQTDFIPVLKPHADYMTLKLIATIFHNLSKITLEEDKSPVDLKQTLALINSIFMNPKQYDDLIKGKQSTLIADVGDLRKLQKLLERLDKTSNQDVLHAAGILRTAVKSSKLLYREQLAEIFFLLGGRLYLSVSNFWRLLMQLKKVCILSDEDFTELCRITARESELSVLHMANYILHYVELKRGSLVHRTRPKSTASERSSPTERATKYHYQVLPDIQSSNQERLTKRKRVKLQQLMMPGPSAVQPAVSQRAVSRTRSFETTESDSSLSQPAVSKRKMEHPVISLLQEFAISTFQTARNNSVRYETPSFAHYQKAVAVLKADKHTGVPTAKRTCIEALQNAITKNQELSEAEVQLVLPMVGRKVKVHKTAVTRVMIEVLRIGAADPEDADRVLDCAFPVASIATVVEVIRAIEKVAKLASHHTA